MGRALHRRAALPLAAAILAIGLVGLGGPAGGPPVARAQNADFFTSSPGPLAKEHAALDAEGRCNDCHVDGSKALSNAKCLGCHDHENLKKRIDAGQGFHASAGVKGRKCETCHVEHKGRGFDMMGWRVIKGQEKGFDHGLTGWALREKHAVIECKDCHKDVNTAGRRTYLGLDKLCGSCHADDQPHAFDRRAMMQCERCHSEVAWKPQRRTMDFDHNSKSDAEFPQEGAHADVACAKCHPKAAFNLKRKRPGNCGNDGCHVSSHKDHLFDTKACDWCHSPTLRSLKKFAFDHGARTRFSLAGAHGKQTCYKCHTKALGTRKPERACATCHAGDNPHKDRFAAFGKPVPRCETCHPESSFKPTRFDHDAQTKFALTGKHEQIACRKCHRGDKPFEWERFPKADAGKRCMGCHEHENVHNREHTDLPKAQAPKKPDGTRKLTCLECHSGAGSMAIKKGAVDAIHGVGGRWPLLRKHAVVKCVKCHTDVEYKDTPKECGVRCHEDSLHRGSLGDECSKCHEPGRWEAVRFDHNSDDTDWPLNGLHKEVPTCDDCHPKRVFADTPRACGDNACHGQDDAHRGKLGKQCESCHLETGENIFDHNLMSQYKLDNAHLKVRCAECHPSVTFKPRPTDCYGGGACHEEPEIHKGQYGTGCATCHTTASFKGIQSLHDVGDFALRGSHDRQPCVRCHADRQRPLQGTGNLCITCHKQDDVHANSLSPRCGQCHTQWSFAPARFDHTTVGCNLMGLHRTLPCYECHSTGNFGGLSPTCYGCHKDTVPAANPPAVPDHNGFGTNCSTCHNPDYWVPSQGMGNLFGRESICR